jgi:alpha-ketoglutarate-dependent 2,4-dichlorophenoxyacetate dioxygenase
MNFAIHQLHHHFFAEVVGLDLTRALEDAELKAVQTAIDKYGVLVFRDQSISDDDQVRFSQYFGQPQRSITVHRQDTTRRFQRDELSDISNIDEHGERMDLAHPKRLLQMSTKLWHTDSSFRKPSGKYTFLAAKKLPPADGNTEFADMRAAWDALSEQTRARIDKLQVLHSLSYSRLLAGSPDLDGAERKNLPPTMQDLVRTHPGSHRRGLYLASHAASVVGMPEAEGRALIDELMAFATRREFVHAHVWRPGDMLMWDNRCTMHRAMPFDEALYIREMRRTTVAEDSVEVAAESA